MRPFKMEKDKSVLEVKTIKHTIFLGILIIIHLKDFLYRDHKRLFRNNVRLEV